MRERVAELVNMKQELLEIELARFSPLAVDRLREAMEECRKRGFKTKAKMIADKLNRLSGGNEDKGLGI